MQTPRLFAPRLLSLLAGLFCVLLPVRGSAQGSHLDTTFKFTPVPYEGAAFLHYTTNILVQPDGKILVNGVFDPPATPLTHTLLRLNSDGSVDPGFKVVMSTSGYVDCAALQSDGKILVAGEFTTINGTTEPYLARLNTDGSVDGSFTPPGFTPPFHSLIVQPDGKILVVGGSSNATISRLNSDGSVDTGFAVVNNTGYPVALQTNGKILCTDSIQVNAQGQSETGLIRLNADGTADTGFSGAIFPVDSGPSAIVEQPDGKIVAVGTFASVNGATHANLARLNSDGTVDASFKPTTPSEATLDAVTLQPDGKILIGGNFGAADGAAAGSLARLNADGTLDTSFTIGAFTGDLVTAVAVQPDGKVLAAAATNQVGVQEYYMIDRFNSHPDFFAGEASLDSGVYYLAFSNGDPFGYYSYLTNEDYLYHFDLGYEYVFQAGDENSGVYLYDFASNTFFYTSPGYPFPYLYDFTLGTVLYYYPDTANPGHYTSHPRSFYDFATGAIITK